MWRMAVVLSDRLNCILDPYWVIIRSTATIVILPLSLIDKLVSWSVAAVIVSFQDGMKVG